MRGESRSRIRGGGTPRQASSRRASWRLHLPAIGAEKPRVLLPRRDPAIASLDDPRRDAFVLVRVVHARGGVLLVASSTDRDACGEHAPGGDRKRGER